MDLASMQPEYVKAIIRTRFGSLQAFEGSKGLPSKSVSDVLRGRKSARVEEAILSAIKEEFSESDLSDVSDISRKLHPTHQQITASK